MKKISLGSAVIMCDGTRLAAASGGLYASFLLPDKECPTMRMEFLKGGDGYEWRSGESIELFGVADKNALTLSDVTVYESTNDGLSDKYIVCRLDFYGTKADVSAELKAYPGIELFTLKLYARKATQPEENEDFKIAKAGDNCVFAMAVPKKHYKIHSAEIFDYSDRVNTFVKESDDLSYASSAVTASGNFFFIDNYTENETLFVVRESPTRQSSQNVKKNYDFFINCSRFVQFFNTGLPAELTDEYVSCYEVTFGCRGGKDARDGLLRQYRDLYRFISKCPPQDKLMMISNTWGDRSSGKNLCDKFMLDEIEAAADLGIDAVQIDAGYNLPGWKINPAMFPNGFEPEVRLCREKGIEYGIWFVPKMDNDYADWEKDADILIDFYKTYGITQMKVDGVTLKSRLGEENLRKMFEKFYRETGRKAQINNDITASQRFGFLYNKEYANLFVENRYTAWGNYYPHYTLRAVWQLSKYVPLRRCLFEVLNRELFARVYSENDIFAPKNYPQDYIFAITAFSNPLIWMEMQNLGKEDAALLKKVIAAYKPHQKALFEADVTPLGCEPDGYAVTGLKADLASCGYILAFCEYDEGVLSARVPGAKSFEMIYKSENFGEPDVKLADGSIDIRLTEPRTFAFIKYTK